MLIGTVLTIAGVIGLVLVVIGIRGTTVDHHPHCRKCAFDLIGTPDANTCPECGADLAEPRAIRPYAKRRRQRPLYGGLAILLLTGVLGAGLAWSVANGVNLNPYKPTWMLLSEVRSPRVSTAEAAAVELIARQDARKLSQGQRERLLRIALERHADRAQAWPPTLTLPILHAMADGTLSPAQCQRFMQQIAQPEARVTGVSPAWTDEPITLEVRRNYRAGPILPPVIGESFAGLLHVEMTPTEGVELSAPATAESLVDANAAWYPQGTLMVHAPGEYAIQGELVFRPFWDDMAANWSTRDGSKPDLQPYESLTEFRWPIHFTVTVESRDTGLPTTFEREGVREKILSQVTSAKVTVFRGPPQPSIMVSLYGDDAPADLSMDMLLRQGDKEWSFSGFAAPKGGPFGMQAGGGAPGFDPDSGVPIQIILRPNLDRAVPKRDEIHEVWIGEVVVPTVEIKDSRPAQEAPDDN